MSEWLDREDAFGYVLVYVKSGGEGGEYGDGAGQGPNMKSR